MNLIQTILAIINGDLEPGACTIIDGIKIEVLSVTKFILELPGEAKTICDISGYLSTQYPFLVIE